jgi:hypothetical protein
MGGTLDIVITESPFSKPSNEENFDTGRQIYLDEWEDLFRNVLKVPDIEKCIDEFYADRVKREKMSFQLNLTNNGYEMLGRIWFIFSDAFYLPSEVNKLLEECLDVQQKTKNELALSALESLIFGCNEALKVKSGVWLVSD